MAKKLMGGGGNGERNYLSSHSLTMSSSAAAAMSAAGITHRDIANAAKAVQDASSTQLKDMSDLQVSINILWTCTQRVCVDYWPVRIA